VPLSIFPADLDRPVPGPGVACGHAARQLVHGMHPPFDPSVASRSRHRLTILRPPAEIRNGLQIGPSHSAWSDLRPGVRPDRRIGMRVDSRIC